MRRFFDQVPLPIFFLLWVLLFSSCESDEDDPGITDDGKLLSSEFIALRTPLEAKIFAQAAGLDSLADSLNVNVDVYTITYRTLYKDDPITASGVVCIPRSEKPLDVVSFQHGTIVAHYDAPSVDVGISDTSFGVLQYLSCLGAVFIFPDQIGFGSSTQFLHPYYVREPSALAVTDMIIAARELILEKGKLLSGKLYLAGYSEGGYLTLATHRYMEVNNKVPFGFNLALSFPAAGGYRIKDVQEYMFSRTSYSQPFYLAYVAQAYTEHYEWSQPLSTYFQEPYASRVPGMFDGTFTGDDINDSLTNTIADLLQPNFLANIDSDPQYLHLRTAMSENSLVNFSPNIGVQLFHGDQDSTVPYQSSVEALQQFGNLGSTQVSLTPLRGEDHGSGFIPYMALILRRMGYY